MCGFLCEAKKRPSPTHEEFLRCQTARERFPWSALPQPSAQLWLPVPRTAWGVDRSGEHEVRAPTLDPCGGFGAAAVLPGCCLRCCPKPVPPPCYEREETARGTSPGSLGGEERASGFLPGPGPMGQAVPCRSALLPSPASAAPAGECRLCCGFTETAQPLQPAFSHVPFSGRGFLFFSRGLESSD